MENAEKRSLEPIVVQSCLPHEELAALWTDVVPNRSFRCIAVVGYCELVRQEAMVPERFFDA